MAATLSGCGSSPPTHFFALSGAPPAAAPATLPAGVVLQVDAVTIPPQLDRLELVRRLGANQVGISGFERWAGPLDEQIRRTLSEDLTDRLAPGDVIGPQAASPPANLTHVAVDIDNFAGNVGDVIVLRAHVTILRQDHTLLRTTAAIDEPAPGTDGAGMAAGMSTALGALADQIIQTIERLPPPNS